MNELKFRGGAKIGTISYSWPFVTLVISKDLLVIKILFFGSLVFRKEDIIALEPFSYFLNINKAIRIKHRNPAYKENIEFWTFQNPQAIIDQARMIGFAK